MALALSCESICPGCGLPLNTVSHRDCPSVAAACGTGVARDAVGLRLAAAPGRRQRCSPRDICRRKARTSTGGHTQAAYGQRGDNHRMSRIVDLGMVGADLGALRTLEVGAEST